NSQMNSDNASKPVEAIPPSASCQPPISLSKPDSRRPSKPPRAVPPIYSPIAAGSDSGSNSSPTYAIASAGRPLNARPSSERNASNQVQDSTSTHASPSKLASPSATAITGLRPQLSPSAPAISRQSASESVVSDKARLLL